MSLSITDQSVIALINTVARISISVKDTQSVLVDPTELKLSVMDLGGDVKLQDTWTPSTPGLRIVKSGVGQFYIDFGDQTPNLETNGPVELMFDWRVTLSGVETSHTAQKLKIISVRTASLLPELRQVIDKSRKIVDASNDCFLGYTDSNLLTYLEGGISTINAYQPSVSMSLDYFPMEFKQILIESALITGVMSQQLFAIDTDIPNYNDQGTSFVINHQPQLAAFLNQITQRLDKIIPMMKLQMINSGSVHVQFGPNYRLAQLMSAAPTGSIFRGVYFKG